MIAIQGLDDVLLLNTNDRIIESSIANIFWVKDAVFYTTPLSEGCLAGTRRYWLLSKMNINHIPFQESTIDLEGLLAADELFCCNGIRFIRWVKQLRNTQYSHRLTKELYHLLHK
jgi:branched-subunit amino acid aminotransferase/4-amino-4-deoxychorismate lyase